MLPESIKLLFFGVCLMYSMGTIMELWNKTTVESHKEQSAERNFYRGGVFDGG